MKTSAYRRIAEAIGLPIEEHIALPRTAHPTKSGPGRRHGQAVNHGATPVPLTGEWIGKRTSVQKNSERALKRELGARQFKRQQKAQRRAVLV